MEESTAKHDWQFFFSSPSVRLRRLPAIQFTCINIKFLEMNLKMCLRKNGILQNEYLWYWQDVH